MGSESLDEVRRICDELPECELEGVQHNKLTVRGKTLGWHTVDHHGDGRVALSIKAAKGEAEVLVASDATRFFLPPYVARYGYVGVYLDVKPVDWDEISEFITDAYRLVAPKALVKELDR